MDCAYVFVYRPSWVRCADNVTPENLPIWFDSIEFSLLTYRLYNLKAKVEQFHVQKRCAMDWYEAYPL